MRERITHLAGEVVEGMPWLGTFHSIGVKLLRRHAELVDLRSDFTILDTDDVVRLIKQIIQAEGLAPRRYENANRLFIRSTRTRATTMGSDEVQLSNGNRQGRPTGLQDPASLLIQLAYGFIQDPSRLKAGTLIELPVATTRKMDTMVFEVQPEETLDTPVGRIKAVRVKPRHALLEKGNAPADIWFAPELQYLPVRILVQVEGQPTFMQLSLSAPPMQVRKPSATP